MSKSEYSSTSPPLANSCRFQHGLRRLTQMMAWGTQHSAAHLSNALASALPQASRPSPSPLRYCNDWTIKEACSNAYAHANSCKPSIMKRYRYRPYCTSHRTEAQQSELLTCNVQSDPTQSYPTHQATGPWSSMGADATKHDVAASLRGLHQRIRPKKVNWIK